MILNATINFYSYLSAHLLVSGNCFFVRKGPVKKGGGGVRPCTNVDQNVNISCSDLFIPKTDKNWSKDLKKQLI